MAPERDSVEDTDSIDNEHRTRDDTQRWFPTVDPDTAAGNQDWTGWLTGPTPPQPGGAEGDPDTGDLTDDEDAPAPDIDAPGAATGPDSVSDRGPRRRRIVVYGSAAVVGVLALGAVVTGVIVVSHTATPAGTPPATAAAATSSPQPPQPPSPPVPAAGGAVLPWCPGERAGVRVSGSGAGDRSSGPGLILAMQYGMYVARDPDAVRAVFAPTAAVASQQETRAAIAAIPMGTRHCVDIVAQDLNRYAVSVTEVHPDRSMQTWDTTVTTGIQPDGRLLVTAIAPAQGAQ